MGIRKWISSSLTCVVYFTLARAGDGGWESKSSCVPVTTTVYSVSTSYYEKIVEKTVWSTNIVYITDTTTQIQVQPTTIVQPTTVVNQYTVTQVDVDTVIDTVTTTVISNIAGPTTTITTCPTTPLTGLVTCTSRIVNPTYTPPHPLPSNYLWGCPPGTICTPPQVDCNFEQNLPASSYVCAPKECQPVPERTVPEDFAAEWPNPTDADCAWYTPNPGLFNLNPEFFGLTFDIFDIYGQPVCPSPSPTTTKSGWVDWSTPPPSNSHTPRMPRGMRWNPLARLAKRQAALGIAPAECYSVYNSAAYIAEDIGYDAAILCPPTSEFMRAVGECNSCAATYSSTATQIDDWPTVQDFFIFCQTNGTSTR